MKPPKRAQRLSRFLKREGIFSLFVAFVLLLPATTLAASPVPAFSDLKDGLSTYESGFVEVLDQWGNAFKRTGDTFSYIGGRFSDAAYETADVYASAYRRADLGTPFVRAGETLAYLGASLRNLYFAGIDQYSNFGLAVASFFSPGGERAVLNAPPSQTASANDAYDGPDDSKAPTPEAADGESSIAPEPNEPPTDVTWLGGASGQLAMNSPNRGSQTTSSHTQDSNTGRGTVLGVQSREMTLEAKVNFLIHSTSVLTAGINGALLSITNSLPNLSVSQADLLASENRLRNLIFLQTDEVVDNIPHIDLSLIDGTKLTNSTIVGSSISSSTANLNGLLVDGDTLSVDTVNHRVGIGTTTPSYTLDVNGAIHADTIVTGRPLAGISRLVAMLFQV